MPPIRRLGFLIAILPLAAGLACGHVAPRTSPTLTAAAGAVSPSPLAPPPAAARLILGIEYASAELAGAFQDSGAESAKPYPDQGTWGQVQPGPDKPYNWHRIDAYVAAFQKAGFQHLTLMVRSLAEWAEADPPVRGFHRGDTFPKPEFEDDYAAFVQATVERYDLDGQDDMPGLRWPVTLFGFEPEYSTFWPGDAASYVHLLQLAYPAVKAANPNAQVMAAGLLMTDVFNGYPTASEIEARLAHPDPRIFDKSPSDIARLLDHPEVFDVVDFHALGHYSEISTTAAWLRQQMAQRGYDKPIWIGDTWGGAGLNGWGPAVCPPGPKPSFLEYPATEADRCRVAAALKSLADAKDPGHEAAIAWVRAESAAGVVRKVALAAATGLAGINIGNMEDWEPLMLTQGGAGTTPWQGMVDRDLLTRRFKAYRPAYYALQQIAAVIRSYRSVERLNAGDPRVYLVRFEVEDGRNVVVAWRDGPLWLPGNPQPAAPTRIPVGTSGSVRVEWTVTQGSTPQVETVAPADGEVTLSLGPVPAFLWP